MVPKLSPQLAGLAHIFVGYVCLVGLLIQVVVGILKYRILVTWWHGLGLVSAQYLSVGPSTVHLSVYLPTIMALARLGNPETSSRIPPKFILASSVTLPCT